MKMRKTRTTDPAVMVAVKTTVPARLVYYYRCSAVWRKQTLKNVVVHRIIYIISRQIN